MEQTQSELVYWDKHRIPVNLTIIFSLAVAVFGLYSILSGNDGNIYVLDSRNFAVRMIDVRRSIVACLAGTGRPGYSGDDGNALAATFGSHPQEKFDGPWAMSLDDDGNIYVGDTQNRVVRMIERRTGLISTIAGRHDSKSDERNDPTVQDPMQLKLPRICAMAYHDR